MHDHEDRILAITKLRVQLTQFAVHVVEGQRHHILGTGHFTLGASVNRSAAPR